MPLDVDEGRLDDLEAMRALDPSGMLRATATSAAQLRESAGTAAEALGEEFDGVRPRAVVVCGMGGSAIAGDVLVGVAGAAATAPILVNRGPVLPGWVGAADLVIGVSCSGRTQETLTAVTEAARRGCYLVGIGAGGSQLAEIVTSGRGRHVEVSTVVAPRASLWGLAAPMLVLGARLGLLDLGEATGGLPSGIEVAAARLEALAVACAPDRESFVNPAKELALGLADGLPMAWGSGPCGPVAALRLACQLAENAKAPAVSGSLPEAHHNQVVCLDGAVSALGDDDFFRDRVETPDSARLHLVLVRDDADAEATRLAELSRGLGESRGVRVTEVAAEGAAPLERAASLIGLIDFASVYLAVARGIDPTPIAAIDDLKAGLPRRYA